MEGLHPLRLTPRSAMLGGSAMILTVCSGKAHPRQLIGSALLSDRFERPALTYGYSIRHELIGIPRRLHASTGEAAS